MIHITIVDEIETVELSICQSHHGSIQMCMDSINENKSINMNLSPDEAEALAKYIIEMKNRSVSDWQKHINRK